MFSKNGRCIISLQTERSFIYHIRRLKRLDNKLRIQIKKMLFEPFFFFFFFMSLSIYYYVKEKSINVHCVHG